MGKDLRPWLDVGSFHASSICHASYASKTAAKLVYASHGMADWVSEGRTI